MFTVSKVFANSFTKKAFASFSKSTTAAPSFSLVAAYHATTEHFATMNGTVKWFDVKKGFGFIIPEDGSEDVFVHQSVIHAEGFRSLAEGEPVEFTVKQEASGRISAERCTGPMGAFVQGAPRRPMFDNQGFGGGGFGGPGMGGGGGYGGYGGGGGGYGGGGRGGGGYGGGGRGGGGGGYGGGRGGGGRGGDDMGGLDDFDYGDKGRSN